MRRHQLLYWLAVGFLAALVPPPMALHGQEAALAVGIRIRVHPACAPGLANGSQACAPTIGRFVVRRGDSLWVEREDAAVVAVRWNPGTTVDVSAGLRRHTLGGMGIGALAGIAISIPLVADCKSHGPEMCGLGYFIFPPFGAIFGALVGTFVRTEKWQPLLPNPVALHLRPTSRGMLIVLSTPF